MSDRIFQRFTRDKDQKIAKHVRRESVDPPIAFPYDDLMARHKWVQEPFEGLVPRNGFIADLVLNTRGVAAPLQYWIWIALITVSSVVKRDAWIKWGENELISNLFLIIVGPPGRVKKTTAIDMVENLTEDYTKYFHNDNQKRHKKVNMVRGMATQEGLHQQLKKNTQKKRRDRNEDDEDEGDSTGVLGPEARNDAVMLLPELTSAISKKKYLEGILDKLTSLYDGRKSGEDHVTISRGVERLQNIHFNLVAGTTVGAIKEELPQAALTGGFTSRTIYVYADKTSRVFPLPQVFDGCPTREDLKKRLAWVAENAQGEYTLSPEAMSWYSVWYADFCAQMDDSSPVYQLVHSRMDTILLRVAQLLRIQRYELGNIISEQDVILASVLLDYAYQSSMAMMDLMNSNAEFVNRKIVEDYIIENGPVERGKLWSVMQRRMPFEIFGEAITQLYWEGKIEVVNGKRRSPTMMRTEQYAFTGKRIDVDSDILEKMEKRRKIEAPAEVQTRVKDAIGMQILHNTEETEEEFWGTDVDD
jgi:hypothetical protein